MRTSLVDRLKRWIAAILWILGGGFAFLFNGLGLIADLTAAGFWGDHQIAAQYDHEQPTQADLSGLLCPIFLAPNETGTITATFHNSQPETVNILVKAYITQRESGFDTIHSDFLSIQPGETLHFSWTVTPKNIIEERFILTRIYLMNKDLFFPVPARTDSCGIFITRFLNLNGKISALVMILVSLVGLLLGCAFLFFSHSSLHKSSPRLDVGLYLLAGALIADCMGNILGWVFLTGVFFLVAILLVFILIPQIIIFKFQH